MFNLPRLLLKLSSLDLIYYTLTGRFVQLIVFFGSDGKVIVTTILPRETKITI